MNLDDDDDSVFEQALRADLPSMAEQNRLRQRILAAGIAAGTALGTTNVAAAAQASFGASALSKLSALSWPAKLALAVVVVAPVAAVPLVDEPVPAAALVSQVRSSAESVRARADSKARFGRAAALPLDATEPARAPELLPEPAPANVAARAPVVQPQAAVSPPANVNAGAAQPAAVSDLLAPDAAESSRAQLRNESTLAAETQLLDRAFSALAAGDRKTAQALVAEHAKRFPNGLLRQERERARARLASNPKGE